MIQIDSRVRTSEGQLGRVVAIDNGTVCIKLDDDTYTLRYLSISDDVVLAQPPAAEDVEVVVRFHGKEVYMWKFISGAWEVYVDGVSTGTGCVSLRNALDELYYYVKER